MNCRLGRTTTPSDNDLNFNECVHFKMELVKIMETVFQLKKSDCMDWTGEEVDWKIDKTYTNSTRI